MALIPVQIPERKDPMQNLIGQGLQGSQIYGGGKTMGWWGKAPVAPTTGTEAAAPEVVTATPEAVEYSGVEFAAPEATEIAPAAKEAAAKGGEEYGWEAVGPIGIGTAGMALGMQSRGDYMRKGEKAGNAKYDSPTGPALSSNSWGGDAIRRRMSSSFGDWQPKDFLDAKQSVDLLPFNEGDKSSILKKLTEAFSFAKTFKMG